MFEEIVCLDEVENLNFVDSIFYTPFSMEIIKFICNSNRKLEDTILFYLFFYFLQINDLKTVIFILYASIY